MPKLTSHTLTLDQDEGGWDVPTCSCGWVGPPCPDTEIAAEFYTDHRMAVANG